MIMTIAGVYEPKSDRPLSPMISGDRFGFLCTIEAIIYEKFSR
jgi:hypothetical protein